MTAHKAKAARVGTTPHGLFHTGPGALLFVLVSSIIISPRPCAVPEVSIKTSARRLRSDTVHDAIESSKQGDEEYSDEIEAKVGLIRMNVNVKSADSCRNLFETLAIKKSEGKCEDDIPR